MFQTASDVKRALREVQQPRRAFQVEKTHTDWSNWRQRTDISCRVVVQVVCTYVYDLRGGLRGVWVEPPTSMSCSLRMTLQARFREAVTMALVFLRVMEFPQRRTCNW